MAGNIVVFLVGVVFIVLGISNMRGNISTLHSYHRHRVSEEDRIPFGKQVGLGTIIIPIPIIIVPKPTCFPKGILSSSETRCL